MDQKTSLPLPRFPHLAWTIAGILFIAAWFLWFAGKGLLAPFSGDDMMNLHGYLMKPSRALFLDNLRYWSPSYRPLGGLFYVPLYHLFGLNPLPFRTVCFVILGLNLVLTFWFCRLAAGKTHVAYLATFLVSYHAWFIDLYYSSGTVYELLCFFFYFGAFILYMRIRQAGRMPSATESIGLAALYVCALNAKEMAVTLPLFLALYEWIYHTPRMTARSVIAWPIREGRIALVTAALTIPYVIGKLSPSSAFANTSSYNVSVSPGKFLDAFHLYLNPLLYQDHFFRDPNTIRLLIAMLLLAILSRSRALIFSWFFLTLSLLPVAFIAHYAAFFQYIPSVGWALFAAVSLTMILDALFRAMRKLWPLFPKLEMGRRGTAVLVGVLACLLAPLHARESARTYRGFLSVQPPARQMAAELLRVQPRMKRGARVLFAGDPVPRDTYFLLYVTRLTYNDMAIEVTKTDQPPAAGVNPEEFDAAFSYNNGRLDAMPMRQKEGGAGPR